MASVQSDLSKVPEPETLGLSKRQLPASQEAFLEGKSPYISRTADVKQSCSTGEEL